MKPLRIGLSLAVMLVVTTVMGSNVAAAGGSVCIVRYGVVIVDQGSATCEADGTSVAIARGDGTFAYAYHNGTATASGTGSFARASQQYSDGERAAQLRGRVFWELGDRHRRQQLCLCLCL